MWYLLHFKHEVPEKESYNHKSYNPLRLYEIIKQLKLTKGGEAGVQEALVSYQLMNGRGEGKPDMAYARC